MLQKLIAKNLYRKSLLSYIFWPLSLMYSVVGNLRRFAYHKGILAAYNSSVKIYSIGNIVSGGSGKTPATIWLTNYLKDKGNRVAVSHRGYKGKFEKEIKIISDLVGLKKFAPQAGDEAYLLATKLPGIPIIVGKNRTKAIKKLAREFPELEAIILDDSFQHLKVKHDVDILVFNDVGGVGNGFVLPAGILREPLSACKHCNIIFFNGKGKLPKQLNPYRDKIIFTNYMVTEISTETEMKISSENIKGKIALISGIGLPASFEKTITNLGIIFEKHYVFTDHKNYNQSEIDEILQSRYDYYLTTEKDFAKLRFLETKGKLIIVKIGMDIAESDLGKVEKLLK